MSRVYDLQQRLLAFSVMLLRVAEKLPNTFAGNHPGNQWVRSGTHGALHYGEAQSAESPKDFIHKMKVCLKELRESLNCLTLISMVEWLKPSEIQTETKEANELVSIFVKSVKTAEGNMNGKKHIDP